MTDSRRCYDCEILFVNPFAAYQHCRDVSHTQAWDCSECDIYCSSEEDRDDHYNARHAEYDCGYCGGRTFYGYEAINQHNATKHVHQCNDCSKIFTTPEARDIHASVSHNLTCSQCGQFYRHKNQFNRHLIAPGHQAAIRRYNVSRNPASPPVPSTPRSEPVKCQYCQRFFNAQHDLLLHQVSAHVIESVVQTQALCRSGPDHPATRHSLSPTERPSYLQAPSTRTVVQPPPGSIQCHLCPTISRKSFLTHNALDEHQWSIHADERLEEEKRKLIQPTVPLPVIRPPLSTCDKCPAKFDTESLLWEHKFSFHMNECDNCFRVYFDGPADLKNHRRDVHSFTCPKCPETIFLSSGALSEHKASAHQSPCLKCEKKFETLQDLLRHWQSHYYECTLCSMKLETPLSFDRHVALEHPIQAKAEVQDLGTQHDSEHNITASDSSRIVVSSTRSRISSSQSSVSVSKPACRIPRRCRADAGTQTTQYVCDEHGAVYDTEAELESHLKNSPFHGPKVLECYECNIKVESLLQLHAHIESKPHHTCDGMYILVKRLNRT